MAPDEYRYPTTPDPPSSREKMNPPGFFGVNPEKLGFHQQDLLHPPYFSHFPDEMMKIMATGEAMDRLVKKIILLPPQGRCIRNGSEKLS